MGNRNSSDVRQKNKTPLPLEKRPEVERLQELFPTWNRAAVEDVLTKCNGDEQKAVDAMFRMSVQLYSSPASVQKRKTRKEEEKKRRRLRSKKTKEEKTKDSHSERPSGPIPRPTTAEMWDDPKNQHCWYNVPGKTFDVRVGPNYRKNKTKAPSMSTWYDTVALELFTSNSSPGWMHDHIKMPALSWTMAPLPKPPTRKDGGGGSSDASAPPKRPLPTHVIWNMQYPIYSERRGRYQRLLHCGTQGVYLLGESVARRRAVQRVAFAEEVDVRRRDRRRWGGGGGGGGGEFHPQHDEDERVQVLEGGGTMDQVHCSIH
jgi:hypothetical protein